MSVGMMRFQKIRGQAVELSSQRRPWAIIFMETRSSGAAMVFLRTIQMARQQAYCFSATPVASHDHSLVSRPEPIFRRSRTSQLKERPGLLVEDSALPYLVSTGMIPIVLPRATEPFT